MLTKPQTTNEWNQTPMHVEVEASRLALAERSTAGAGVLRRRPLFAHHRASSRDESRASSKTTKARTRGHSEAARSRVPLPKANRLSPHLRRRGRAPLAHCTLSSSARSRGSAFRPAAQGRRAVARLQPSAVSSTDAATARRRSLFVTSNVLAHNNKQSGARRLAPVPRFPLMATMPAEWEGRQGPPVTRVRHVVVKNGGDLSS